MANLEHKLSSKIGTDFALNTGTNIPSVGFGTWKIPKESAKEIIQRAFESGYRHFDCALEYGNQEEIGQALHDMMEKNHISRGEVFVTSKLWNTHHMRHAAYDDLSTTLRQLQLHHIDLWLMHWPFSFSSLPAKGNSNHMQETKDQNGKVIPDDTSILETWQAMEKMHKDGKARAIGVCNFPLSILRQLLNSCEIPPAVLQIEQHPYLQQTELIEFCQSKGIHVTAYSPLGSQMEGSVNLLADPVLNEIAKKHNKTPSQVVLQWNLLRHISVIPKACSLDHMKENLEVFDFQLTSDEIRQIEGLDRNLRFVSPKKIWNLPLFPDETGDVEISQAVGEMYGSLNTEAR